MKAALLAVLLLLTACTTNYYIIEPSNVTNLTVTDTLQTNALYVTGITEIFTVANVTHNGSNLSVGQLTWYVDESIGAEKLVLVYKEQNGTVLTGSVNLN